MWGAERSLEELSTWERIPSVDEIAELFGPLVAAGRVRALHLGYSQDGTPIIAYGPSHAEASSRDRDVVLLLGGATGNSTLTVALVAQIFASATDNRDEVPVDLWVLPAVSPAQLRLSDATLGQLRPSVAEYVSSVRSAYAPWEDPELSCPIDALPLLQPDRKDDLPDGWPEGWLASSSEAIALARAVIHLQPEVVVSVREVPAGGVTVAVSHDLPAEFSRRLVNAATVDGTLAPQRTAKLRKGRWHQDIDGLVSVEDLHQCVARLERSSDEQSDGERVFVGGSAIWLLLETVAPDGTYVALDMPRLSAKAFHDTTESDQTRATETLMEYRGAEHVPYLVKRFWQPGHPVHEMEISSLRQPSERVDEPVVEDEIASVGWLGAEAVAQRQKVLLQAIEAFEDRLAHLSTGQHLRALQIMRQERAGFDVRIRPLLSNRRYSAPATTADVAWWERGYRLQTALIVSEALNVLRGEHAENRAVQALKRELQTLIDQEMRPSRQTFRSVAPATLMRATLEVLEVLTSGLVGGDLQLARATLRRDRLAKRREQANRRARELRNLKRPKSERRAMEALRDELDLQIQATETLMSAYRSKAVPTAIEGPSSAEDLTSASQQPVLDAPEVLTADDDAESCHPSPMSDGAVSGIEVAVDCEDERKDPMAAAGTTAYPEASGDEATAPQDPQTPATAGEGDQQPPATVLQAPGADDALPTPLGSGDFSDFPPDPPQLDRAGEDEPFPGGPDSSEGQAVATVGSQDLVPVVDPPGSALERSDAFETTLPRGIRMMPEWPNRDPLIWDEQLPRYRAPVLAAVLIDRSDGEQVGLPVSEAVIVDQVTETGVEHARAVEAIGEHRVVPADGFLRRRVELDGVFSEQLVRLEVPQPTGGRFQRLLRRRVHR